MNALCSLVLTETLNDTRCSFLTQVHRAALFLQTPELTQNPNEIPALFFVTFFGICMENSKITEEFQDF